MLVSLSILYLMKNYKLTFHGRVVFSQILRRRPVFTCTLMMNVYLHYECLWSFSTSYVSLCHVGKSGDTHLVLYTKYERRRASLLLWDKLRIYDSLLANAHDVMRGKHNYTLLWEVGVGEIQSKSADCYACLSRRSQLIRIRYWIWLEPNCDISISLYWSKFAAGN